MGAWGVGPFDNDTAADWLAGLDDAIPNASAFTFRPVVAIEPELYLEEPEASEAIAAAELVAAIHGHAGAAVLARPELILWAEDHADWATPDLVNEAIAAVGRVRSASELRDLWAETGDFEDWLGVLDNLLDRLSV